MDDFQNRLDVLVKLANQLVETLNDPNTAKEAAAPPLTAEDRARIREEAKDDLLEVVDMLATAAEYSHSYYSLIDIAGRLHVNHAPPPK